MSIDRNEAIARIRKALRERSGKSWSVTGGRGTAWGWITVHSPPRRRVDRAGEPCPDGYLSEADREELASLMGFDRPVHCQGLSIAASSDYWTEHVDRAEGRTPSVIGQPYWD